MDLALNITDKRHTAEWLCTAVETAIQARALEALDLSEIFEIDDNSEVDTLKESRTCLKSS